MAYKCNDCGEEYFSNIKFNVKIIHPNDGEFIQTENADMCPDCVATWFSECPEDVKSAIITRVEAI